ncbi:zf-HC2 domain-containing protein [Streptomyces sp. NPDC047028]|uniref:zf-HC2 domain-containing protein n=1 Tax=Streptomyces sp. NPDC047028 TaxID=3155793 RepID=UPI0034113B48
MASDVTCERVRAYGAELALGVLPGRERAEAVAHLDQCADCREHVGQLTLIGDRLIGLLPDREPPLGFESRAALRMTPAAPTLQERPQPRGPGRLRQGLGGPARRARLRIASAAVAAALVCGFGGWAVGTAVEQAASSSTASSALESERLLVGDLTTPGGRGRSVGEVYAHPGSPGWIFVSLDAAASGTPYTGRVVCLLEHTDGSSVRVGDFAVRDGHGEWGVAAHVDPAALSGARLLSTGGTLLARAQLQTGHIQTPAD